MFSTYLILIAMTSWLPLVAGVEGEDVVNSLQEALNRRGDVSIEICAILNDTTGI